MAWITAACAAGLTCGIKAMTFDLSVLVTSLDAYPYILVRMIEFQKLKKLAIVWLSTQVAIDVVIACALPRVGVLFGSTFGGMLTWV